MVKGGKGEFQIDVKNQEEWEDLLSKDGLKVIDIYQEWSGPCQSVLSLFKKIKEEMNDDKLYFASANVDAINTLEKYRGRSEPYFLIFGGQSLVAVVKGADCPILKSTITEMLKQEHAVLAGEMTRMEIEDIYLKKIEEEMAAEAKRKKLQKEITQECCPLIFHSDLQTATVKAILELLDDAQFEILRDEIVTLDPILLDEIQEDAEIDADFVNEINLLIKDSLRCLIVAKGPDGAINELAKLIGPEVLEEPPAGREFESIRDKFGGGKPNSCVTAPYSKELAEKFLKIIFPEFIPPKIIIYMPDVEEIRQSIRPQEGQLKIVEEAEDSEESSKVPEYVGSPRVIVLVKPPAYDNYRNAVVADLESGGFKILSTRDYAFTEEEAREFYADFASLSSFELMISLMISGNSFIIMASREDAFKALKLMLGPESLSQASKDSPDSLRGKYSSLPGVSKEDDLTWIDGTLTESSAQDCLNKFFPIEETFALLKPDSQSAWDDIIEDIKNGGFKIVARKEVELTPDDVRVIYEAHIDKSYFDNLMRHMTSGPSLALILRAQDAVKKWSKLIGPTDPDFAVDSYPMDVKPGDICLRATYGRSYLENAAHGSSTQEDAKKCIQWIFFGATNDDAEDSGIEFDVSYPSEEDQDSGRQRDVDITMATQEDDKEEGGGIESITQSRRGEEAPNKNEHGSVIATELPYVAEDYPTGGGHYKVDAENEETERKDETQVPVATAESVPEASELKEVDGDDRTTFASPVPIEQSELEKNSNNFKSLPWKSSKMRLKRTK